MFNPGLLFRVAHLLGSVENSGMICCHLSLALLHSEWPKLHRVLAILSVIGLEYFSKAVVMKRTITVFIRL